MYLLARCRELAVLLGIVLALSLIGCSGSGENDGKSQTATSSVRSAQAVSPSQARLLGDLDDDDDPSVGDAIRILRIVVGLDPEDPCADANENGSTDVGDAIKVLRCVVGLDTWPIGECGGDPGEETIGPDGQTLVLVPDGSFMMGSNEEGSDEQPIHQVTLDGFWIGSCEVTNDQYAAFLNEIDPINVNQWIDIPNVYCEIEYVGGTYQAKAQHGPHPVVCVSWYGATAYCDHYGYTLPTEAQWEYAARGPDAREYPWGNEWDGSRLCWWEKRGPGGLTFPVGSFPVGASWCGALDMAGNVWEWCADWYDSDYYENSPSHNPTGPSSGSLRVLRGGSWGNDYPRYFRCALRNYSDLVPGYRGRYYGFRCARGL